MFQSNPIFLSGALVLIHRRVNLGLTRGNRDGGGAQKNSKNRRVFFSRYLAANDDSILVRREAKKNDKAVVWPLHNIAITNMVWCMVYNRGVGGGAYIARWSCNSIAIG